MKRKDAARRCGRAIRRETGLALPLAMTIAKRVVRGDLAALFEPRFAGVIVEDHSIMREHEIRGPRAVAPLLDIMHEWT